MYIGIYALLKKFNVGFLWFHLKLYIQLKFSFIIQRNQLQYFIVYICFLNSPCSYIMISKLYLNLDWNIVLEKKDCRHILIVYLAQMQGEKIVVSNGLFFRLQLIPSCSKFEEFSFSIPNKFRFYLYFDYLFEFMLLIHVNMNINLFFIARSRFKFEFICTRNSTSFKMS